MRVDKDQTEFHEAASAVDDFNRLELRRCRLLLRRLRYLDQQIKTNGGMKDGGGNGGAAFAEWEVEALEWVLSEVGFLEERVSK